MESVRISTEGLSGRARIELVRDAAFDLFAPGAQAGHLFRALMVGYMGNNLLPLRAGEIVRVYVASRHGPRSTR